MRRFSRTSNAGNQNTSMPTSPPGSFTQPGGQQPRAANGPTAMRGGPPPPPPPPQSGPGSQHDELRPSSMGTDHSYEFAPPRSVSHGNQPVSSLPVAGLSRTDQIVLRYFWEEKVQLNKSRDLHFLKVPHFSSHPSHNELVPFCEIYHLVRSTPRATIIGLGSANGVYIGFELFTGSELQLNIHDEWRNVSHYRVNFRSYDSLMTDPNAEAIFRSWPKPLTIEFLDDQYQKWSLDLTSLCWDGREVREFGVGGSKQGASSVLL